jgi:hypothetical protein
MKILAVNLGFSGCQLRKILRVFKSLIPNSFHPAATYPKVQCLHERNVTGQEPLFAAQWRLALELVGGNWTGKGEDL